MAKTVPANQTQERRGAKQVIFIDGVNGELIWVELVTSEKISIGKPDRVALGSSGLKCCFERSNQELVRILSRINLDVEHSKRIRLRMPMRVIDGS